MALVCHPTISGLWIDPERYQQGAGTYAIVIGVSQYDPPTATTRQTRLALTPLAVSALTAFRFFEWLQDGYTHPAAPLSACWLLLSPTDAEITQEPRIAQVGSVPSYTRCRTALREWFEQMRCLPVGIQQQSRAIFFFSGHGIEQKTKQQLLLPSDYAHQQAYDDAISTANLTLGLASLHVRQQFFFIDACRHTMASLRHLDLIGQRIFPQPNPEAFNSERMSAIYYASATGSTAWQPHHPSSGISMFGQALLEGLMGEAAIHEDGASSIRVTIASLQRYMNQRVNTLLARQGAQQKQMIRLEGELGHDITITEVPSPPNQTTTPRVAERHHMLPPTTDLDQQPNDYALFRRVTAIMCVFPELDDSAALRGLLSAHPYIIPHLNHLPITAYHRTDRANRLAAYLLYTTHDHRTLLLAVLEVLANHTPDISLRQQISTLIEETRG